MDERRPAADAGRVGIAHYLGGMDTSADQQSILRYALEQAVARTRSAELAERMKAAGKPDRGSSASARTWVELGKAMLAGGNIAASEALIFLTFAVEGVHDRRWLDGAYPEIEELSAQMREIERAAGLTPDQYWKKGDAPDEHRQLEDAYETALAGRFEETLREFDLPDLAELWRTDRAEYDRLREIGRRSIFARDDHLGAVATLITLYEAEAEAERSAAAGAFYAATVMLGSAAEARLLERFLSRPEETRRALSGVGRTNRSRNGDPLHWTLDHMLAVAEQAGWLGVIEDEQVGARVRPWLLSVRDTVSVRLGACGSFGRLALSCSRR